LKELGSHLLKLLDLQVELKRMISVLELFRDDYIEDIRDLHNINFALVITLEKIAGQMDQALTRADQSWRRLAANSG
jgi:hypothetical protein